MKIHTQFLFGVAAMALSGLAYAGSDESPHEIYGWDVFCRGADGLTAHAYEADDDFYIEYGGGSIKENRVWANTDQYDDRTKILLFSTNQSVSKGADVAMSIVRDETSGPGYGKGVITIEGGTSDLNCYVRYGSDEDAFDSIFKKPFPKVAAPARL